MGSDNSCFPASILDIKDPSPVTMAMGLEGFFWLWPFINYDRSEDVNVCTQLISRLSHHKPGSKPFSPASLTLGCDTVFSEP